MGKTFVEKILGAKTGEIVFRSPDKVLTHDNTASIIKTFEKMGGSKVYDPKRHLIVLDHNAPPTNSGLANDYQAIREFVKQQRINDFYDEGHGICHQIMSRHARPGMIITGSDSHTCTAGAFNALAVGTDRTESAGIWKTGETWFRVPPSLKVNLSGKLSEGVYAKDLSLWIIGMIGSSGANYLSIEFHGEGLQNLDISERMTIANLASEMGAKNAVFPPDNILADYLEVEKIKNGIWADPDASYLKTIHINLEDIYPLIAVPHHVDNVRAVAEIEGTPVQQGLIGTCTNGRIEDIRVAAEILNGHKIAPGFRLHIIPASKDIYLQALREGLVEPLIEAGAVFLNASCGPCLGTGQGIPPDDTRVISTANRNFKGRMGNKNSSVYLASPATVSWSAIKGKVTDPRLSPCNEKFPYLKKSNAKSDIDEDEIRRKGKIWDYSDMDNINTDQMFAGNLTYNILSSDPAKIIPHLFQGFDINFSKKAQKGDIILAGENFGCGSSREHPSVGLAYLGIRAVIVKSVNRIFFRSAINQGLLVIVSPDAIENFNKSGKKLELDEKEGIINCGDAHIKIPELPEKLKQVLDKKGLVNWISEFAN